MTTVDANCWIAAFDPLDAFHEPSRVLFQRLTEREILIYAPELVLVEVGCALARKYRDPVQGVRAVRAIRRNPLIRLYPHTGRLLVGSIRLGYLRGADALYAATAQMTGTRLISWDNELIQRAGALTPTAWLDANS